MSIKCRGLLGLLRLSHCINKAFMFTSAEFMSKNVTFKRQKRHRDFFAWFWLDFFYFHIKRLYLSHINEIFVAEAMFLCAVDKY